MSQRAARGFTLIELLVAVTLATGIAMLAASLMHTLISNSARSEQRLAQHQVVGDLRLLLERAWARRQVEGFLASDTVLQFVSSDPAVGAQPIELACESQAPAGQTLRLYRSVRQGPTAAEDAGETLVDGLRQCRFAYLVPPAGPKDAAQWQSRWPAQSGAPTVLRLDLSTAAGALPPLIVAVDNP